MIQAKELRIGNFVNILHPVTMKWNHEAIKGKTIANIENYPIHELITDHIMPIPLTPEVLGRFGFKVNEYAASKRIHSTPYKSYIYYNLESGELGLCIENSDFGTEFTEVGELNIKLPHIKYIHHLQNIFLDLAGEELTYQP